MDKMELHEKIEYTRKYRGKSRKELADHLGVSVSSIGNIESGIRPIKPVVLKAISKFLDVPFEFYMNEDVRTIEELFENYNAKTIASNMEKYGGYFKLVDLAKDAGVTVDEFETFLELRRKIKRDGD